MKNTFLNKKKNIQIRNAISEYFSYRSIISSAKFALQITTLCLAHKHPIQQAYHSLLLPKLLSVQEALLLPL